MLLPHACVNAGQKWEKSFGPERCARALVAERQAAEGVKLAAAQELV